MRPRSLNFEQLVMQNKRELLDDKESISEIEIRLEKKQAVIREENQERP
ncbi:hypothetical protein J2Z83_000361 [Virgibacillus natechei]|uniref:FbpB family small basic protein n=1 Tax=Virgibacillus natechei TaxID=1216297 RepID=A0ABS4IBG6_9BACI|nr:FbpB family small basic protein [Virgibacillus natechei]MBP1968269.1 hypothetical protein [Virgibacillus natechei]UZD14465.1 FbpB family small basic protein [Virgibacillus natechei]